jgi:hypothetical protein
MIYEKGAANYRDVTCPEGYKFDVPRTSQENQELHNTLLRYWNVTVPPFYASLMDHQRREQHAIELAHISDNPSSELLDKEAMAAMPHKRCDPDNEVSDAQNGKDNGNHGEESGEQAESRSSSPSPLPSKGHGGRITSGSSKDEWMQVRAMKTSESAPPLKAITVMPGEGMIWIDISSWQTAGCWVPGGMHGICPYQDPDNTVALQEIIKVSTIGKPLFLLFCVGDHCHGPWIPFCY